MLLGTGHGGRHCRSLALAVCFIVPLAMLCVCRPGCQHCECAHMEHPGVLVLSLVDSTFVAGGQPAAAV